MITQYPARTFIGPNNSLGLGDLTNDAWGVQKMSLPYSIFHGMWTFDIPESMWFKYENGTQVYTSTNIVSSGGVAKIFTSGAVDSATLESRECPRYQPNRGHLFSTAGWMPSKTAAAVRDWGLFTTRNGVFFRLKSDGKLYAVLRTAGVEVREEEIDTSVLTGFDVEKGNIYDIQFQWRSVGNYKFYIGDTATGASKLVHVFDNLNTLTAPSMEDPALPIAFKVTNAGADAEMYFGCADVTSENGNTELLQFQSADISNASVNGTNVPVLSIYAPLEAATGRPNTRSLTLARVSVTCDKKATFRVWSTRNAAAFTGATFASINQGSFVQTDSPDSATGAVRATAVNTALLNRITTIPVQAGASREVDNPYPQGIVFPVVRGDYIVLTVTVTNGVADAVIEWGEHI